MEYLEFVAGLWASRRRRPGAKAEELLKWLGRGQPRPALRGFLARHEAEGGGWPPPIHDPKLLILDEPLTGLDAAVARQVKDLLQARVAAGATVILTTHILEVAERIADRIGIIQRGRLLAEGISTICAPAPASRKGRSRTCSCKLIDASEATVIGQPGSILWLLHNEVRLGWRDMFARRGSRRGLIVAGILITVFTVLGVAGGPRPAQRALPISPLPAMIADLLALAVFSLMLSQTCQASHALYSRGDLHLVLRPDRAVQWPVPGFVAIAFNVCAFALMFGLFLIPVAVIGHPAGPAPGGLGGRWR
jgi:hypothetical protein